MPTPSSCNPYSIPAIIHRCVVSATISAVSISHFTGFISLFEKAQINSASFLFSIWWPINNIRQNASCLPYRYYQHHNKSINFFHPTSIVRAIYPSVAIRQWSVFLSQFPATPLPFPPLSPFHTHTVTLVRLFCVSLARLCVCPLSLQYFGLFFRIKLRVVLS